MGNEPTIRLTVALTHPVQYFSPWFRYLTAQHPEIALTVVYAASPSAAQQGTGFGRAFEWDVPLLEGYKSVVVRQALDGESFHSDDFHGLDVPEFPDAVLATKPDVVLVSGWQSVSLTRVVESCRRARVPLIYRGDTFGFSPRPGRPELLAKCESILWGWRTAAKLRKFQGWLSVGKRVRNHLIARGVPPSLIFSSPHCVDSEFFEREARPFQEPIPRAKVRADLGAKPDSFVVLFIGKLEENKRPLDLLRAVAGCEFPVHVLMVGAGPLEQACRGEAERFKISIHFAGFRNQKALGQYYAAADCLVLPSVRETWGLVVNEALSTGLPCVVSESVGCAPDLIESGETGEVFPVGNAHALSEALSKVRNYAGEKCDRACRTKAATHSFEHAARGLIAACESVVQHRFETEAPRVICACGHMVLVSGLEKMTFEVLRILRRRGGAVHCIVNSWENFRITRLAEDIGASWSIGLYYHPFQRRDLNLQKIFLMVSDMIRTSTSLLIDAAQFEPTHIFLPDFLTATRNAPALVLLRLAGIKVILRIGNAPVRSPFWDKFLLYAVMPFVDRIVGNAEHSARHLVEIGVPRKKIDFIYNCIPGEKEIPRVIPLEREAFQTIIFVGQIIPEKGVDLLLEAVGLLVGRFTEVKLLIIGRMEGWYSPSYGDYRERLRERAVEADLRGHVEFLGQRSDVLDLYRRAGIHCAPSIGPEGLPNVVLEAKLLGRPSVAFNYNSFPELISHRGDGWLCAEQTAEALAEGLSYFLEDEERIAVAGQRARESLKRFSVETFRERWAAEFAV